MMTGRVMHLTAHCSLWNPAQKPVMVSIFYMKFAAHCWGAGQEAQLQLKRLDFRTFYVNIAPVFCGIECIFRKGLGEASVFQISVTSVYLTPRPKGLWQ